MTLTPQFKLIGASVLILSAPLVAAIQGASAPAVARILLALVALGGLAAWFLRARRVVNSSPIQSVPRLSLTQRIGLNTSTGVALIEVDGRAYLVVHGQGFAKIRPVPRSAPLESRRPMPINLAEGIAS